MVFWPKASKSSSQYYQIKKRHILFFNSQLYKLKKSPSWETSDELFTSVIKRFKKSNYTF